MADLSRHELDTFLVKLKQLDEYTRYHHGETWKPYPKQEAFFQLSRDRRESMIFAGNQSGKSDAGAYASACHLTGRYPPWWTGKRFDKPTKGWICGDTSVTVRDIQQAKLCGLPGVEEAFGTGMIAREDFIGTPSLSRGVTDAYDTMSVRHITGGISQATFKSYEMGRKKFQGSTLDFIWTDEECPADIYTEILARITTTNGIVFGTFTPLQGRTDLVVRYMDKPDPSRGYVMMSLTEAGHMTPQMIEDAIKGYPEHEREARIHGVPILGQGRVFPYSEDLIKWSPPPVDAIPEYWCKMWALDFSHGGSHPFAAVLMLWDRDTDVIYVYHAFKIAGGTPADHAVPVFQIAGEAPVAWPHDGGIVLGGLTSSDFASIKEQYKARGLRMLGKHATFPDGGFGTEAGIMMMQQRMLSGRLKVAEHLTDWWQEFRNYHRKDGMLVKVNDDLMSATRIGVMQIRSAAPVLLGPAKPLWAQRSDRKHHRIAQGVDFPLN